MNYEEARVYLDNISGYGSVLGLENMKELLSRLGNPQKDLKFIHISGTNGKGSVLAYLSTILTDSGYKTGRYISPTLDTYRERIQVDGEYIERESLANHVSAIAKAAEDMKRDNAGIPTVFEVETVLAFLYFREKNCDIVVLETGLGGSLDATNIIDTTVLEIITSVSMDHQGVLGNTLEEIAEQKAGIIKKNTKVVSSKQLPGPLAVIRKKCEEKNCTLRISDPSLIHIKERNIKDQIFSYKNWENVSISLPGSYQPENAAIALEAVEELAKLGFDLKKEIVIGALKKTKWKGRFTLISENPVIIIDGAHNVAGAKALMESLRLYFDGKKFIYIFGVFKDKDYKQMIDITAKDAEHIITVETANNPRALAAKELCDAVKTVNESCEAAVSLDDAAKKAIALAKDDGDVVIVAFGSLSFLSGIEKAFCN